MRSWLRDLSRPYHVGTVSHMRKADETTFVRHMLYTMAAAMMPTQVEEKPGHRASDSAPWRRTPGCAKEAAGGKRSKVGTCSLCRCSVQTHSSGSACSMRLTEIAHSPHHEEGNHCEQGLVPLVGAITGSEPLTG